MNTFHFLKLHLKDTASELHSTQKSEQEYI